MGISAVMLDLNDNASTAGMNRARDAPPPRDLLLGIDSGRSRVPMGVSTDRSSFRNDEPSGCALHVILCFQPCGDMALAGGHPCKWCHDNAIRQLKIAKPQGAKQARVSSLSYCTVISPMSMATNSGSFTIW